jgi:hypothetical protein
MIVGIEVSRKLPHFIHFNLGAYSTEAEAHDAFVEKAKVNFWSAAYANASQTK